MKEIYILNIYYGTHKTEVEVKDNDFFRWIYELSEEFSITKNYRKVKDETNKRTIKAVEYYITNYYDKKELVGTVITV